MNPTSDAYLALSAGVAFFDRSDRVRLDVSGPDRAKFLHNLTTNDVKRLAVGHGHEAFVTSPQGKTIGYVILLAGDDRIVLRTDPGALTSFLPHLQKYGIFDDVALDDASARTFEFHLAGPRAEDLLVGLGAAVPDARDLAHRLTQVGDRDVRVVRESPTGRPGLTLIGEGEAAAAVSTRLREAGVAMGLAEGDAGTFEAARIEAGTPRFGGEVTVDNLPQEIGRDARAINFVKGCYLGQETVARIDALGHVNKQLMGLMLERGAVPPAGASVEAEGKVVGTITSAADSPGWSRPVALAVLRVAAAKPGAEVRVAIGDTSLTARVADLPMLPPDGRADPGRQP